MPLEFRYLENDDHKKMTEQVETLKKMISTKVPSIDFEHYGLLDHVKGRCDYDAYDRYDAEHHDEGESFGHMVSEDIPTYGEPEMNEPNPPEPVIEEEPEDTAEIEYPETGYENEEGYEPEAENENENYEYDHENEDEVL